MFSEQTPTILAPKECWRAKGRRRGERRGKEEQKGEKGEREGGTREGGEERRVYTASLPRLHSARTGCLTTSGEGMSVHPTHCTWRHLKQSSPPTGCQTCSPSRPACAGRRWTQETVATCSPFTWKKTEKQDAVGDKKQISVCPQEARVHVGWGMSRNTVECIPSVLVWVGSTDWV